MKSAMRVACARENAIDAAAYPTPEEELMVAPPDAAVADPEVAVAEATDSGEVEALQTFNEEVNQDIAEAEGIVEQVKEAGDGVDQLTVEVAQERLQTIFGRYPQLNKLRNARESADGNPLDPSDLPSAYDQSLDLISDSEQNLEYMKAAANEGLKELVNRIAVNTKDMFRWSESYIKHVRNAAANAKKIAASGAVPKADAKYTNAVRIAHFTNADQKPLYMAADFIKGGEEVSAALRATLKMAGTLDTAFNFFGRASGRMDLNAVFSGVPTNQHGEFMLTGKTSFYGEVSTMSGLKLVNTESLKDLAEAIRDVKFDNSNVWTVSELKSAGVLELPVLTADEIVKQLTALEGYARSLMDDFRIVDKYASMNSMVQNQSITDVVIDTGLKALANRESAMLTGKIKSVVMNAYYASDRAASNKSKALNCLLDYYNWCLGQHKTPAKEGITGAIVGFVSAVGLGITGAPMAAEAGRLDREIKRVADEITRLSKKMSEDGSLPEEDRAFLSKVSDYSAGDIVTGFVLGTIFAPIHNTIRGSQIEDRSKELNKLIGEYKALVAKNKPDAAKESMQGVFHGNYTNNETAKAVLDALKPVAGKEVDKIVKVGSSKFTVESFLKIEDAIAANHNGVDIKNPKGTIAFATNGNGDYYLADADGNTMYLSHDSGKATPVGISAVDLIAQAS